MSRLFLAEGINHFLISGNDLQECVADAVAMDAVGITLGCAADTLTDKNATKKNIMGWLKQTVEDAKTGKVSYIGMSISGHGTHQVMPDGTLEGAIVCYNLSELNGNWNPDGLITASEFQNLVNQIPPICIGEFWLDTCYSQAMTRALVKGNMPRSKSIHNPGNTAGLLRVADNPMHGKLNNNIIVWNACSEAQESADAPWLKHGAFTYYWLEAWKKNPKASRVDIITKIRVAIKAGGFDQVPRLSCGSAAGQGMVGV